MNKLNKFISRVIHFNRDSFLPCLFLWGLLWGAAKAKWGNRISSAHSINEVVGLWGELALCRSFDPSLSGTRVNGEKVIQLCLPEPWINTKLKLAQWIVVRVVRGFPAHKWPHYDELFFQGACSSRMRCKICQLISPARRSDLNVIEPVPRDAPSFEHPMTYTLMSNTAKNSAIV